MKGYILNPANGDKGVDVEPLLKLLGLKGQEVTLDELTDIVNSKTKPEDAIDFTIYNIDKIVSEQNVYNLAYPLECQLIEQKDFFVIASQNLDIAGRGKTVEEAEMNFFEAFDYIYTHYIKLSDTEITYNIFKIKELLNSLVIK